VLCVVYPHMTSVAGDLMAIVWPAGAAAPVGLIGAGRSGELATIDAVRRRGHEAMPERGVLTVTVPGTVEAWGRLIERFGTLGWSPVLEPAAALAQDGYTITSHSERWPARSCAVTNPSRLEIAAAMAAAISPR